MYTIEGFKQMYGEYDPDDLLDMLNISSEELLERFEDKIEDYIERNEEDDEEDYDNS